ncbi:MAG: flagellar biosynthesis protein FliQ [Candidatus Rokubacteria bacterium]|nr:flagellar biosynthesis protein FliQ [Candidatus Rokubacteria bacterium]
MTPEVAMDIARQALWATIVLVGPVLVAGALAGLFTSILQAVTQIHEQTLSFLPKVAASILVLVAFGPWMLRFMIDFTQTLILSLSRYTG